MPKLKTRPDRYESLYNLIRGRMSRNGVTQETVGLWLGCCRQTVTKKLAHPELLTLGELSKLCVHLDIPADDVRPKIPIR